MGSPTATPAFVASVSGGGLSGAVQRRAVGRGGLGGGGGGGRAVGRRPSPAAAAAVAGGRRLRSIGWLTGDPKQGPLRCARLAGRGASAAHGASARTPAMAAAGAGGAAAAAVAAEEAEPFRCASYEMNAVLRTLTAPGRYAAGGVAAELPNPLLRVDGVDEPLSWPAPASWVRAAVAVAERAPFGLGDASVVDAGVRDSWRILPGGMTFTNGPAWEAALATLVGGEVREGLGVTGPVRAELHNLLLYETGGHFAEHTDTEKTPGMFGTLVLTLPCEHSGGALVVRHAGEEMRFPKADVAGSPASLAAPTWAAYYGDCKHEVQPVTSGYRISLVYNLLIDEDKDAAEGKSKKRKTDVSTPAVPSLDPTVEALEAMASRWTKSLREWPPKKEEPEKERDWYYSSYKEPEDVVPDKMVYILEHKYTERGLSWDAFKGADAALIGALLRTRLPAASAGTAGKGAPAKAADGKAPRAAKGAAAGAPVPRPYLLYVARATVSTVELSDQGTEETERTITVESDWLPAPGQGAAALPTPVAMEDLHYAQEVSHFGHYAQRPPSRRLCSSYGASGQADRYTYEPCGNSPGEFSTWYHTYVLLMQPAPSLL